MSRWRIYRYWKMGMSLVTFQVACTYSIEDAFRFMDESDFVRNKSRGFLIKKVGSKHRLFTVKDWQFWHGHEYEPQTPPPPKAEPEPPAPAVTQLPLLEAPPGEVFKSVWRERPPTKRRL